MINKRDTRFEILRIVSMLFIVLCHFGIDGNWHNNIGMMRLKTEQFHALGQVGVYIFVMISGYFLSTRETNLKKQIKRVVPLWVETVFYSWLILIVGFIARFKSLNRITILDSVFPVSFSEYWFMTSFIILMLLLEPINQFIDFLGKKDFILYFSIIFFFSGIIPVIKDFRAPFGGVMSFGILLSAYLIGAYLRRYNIKVDFLISILLIVIGIGLEYLMMYLLRYKNITKFNYGLLPMTAAVGTFTLFLNIKPFYNRVINYFSTSVLAVYLITCSTVLYYYYQKKVFNLGKFQNTSFLLLVEIGASIISVVVFCLVDKIFRPIYLRISNKILQKLIK